MIPFFLGLLKKQTEGSLGPYFLKCTSSTVMGERGFVFLP